MKIEEQRDDKKRQQEKKERVQEEFSKFADKKRLQSVNVFLPSRAGQL